MRVRAGLALLVALALAGPARGSPDHAHGPAADSTESARYAAPPAGSYALPPIQRVAAHRLLDPAGRPTPILGPDGVSFVAFVYLSCPEACPRTLAVFQRLDRELASDPALAQRVRLVTVSFDPERDGPEALVRLREALAPRTAWRFLTAPDRDVLEPVLRDYGQDAVPLIGPDGAHTGLLRHVLKVFLVDGQGQVRNVYSSDFVDWRLLRNDALTVLDEAESPAPGG